MQNVPQAYICNRTASVRGKEYFLNYLYYVLKVPEIFWRLTDLEWLDGAWVCFTSQPDRPVCTLYELYVKIVYFACYLFIDRTGQNKRTFKVELFNTI